MIGEQQKIQIQKVAADRGISVAFQEGLITLSRGTVGEGNALHEIEIGTLIAIREVVGDFSISYDDDAFYGDIGPSSRPSFDLEIK